MAPEALRPVWGAGNRWTCSIHFEGAAGPGGRAMTKSLKALTCRAMLERSGARLRNVNETVRHHPGFQ